MWYEMLAIVFLMLVFCFFMELLTVKVMLSMFNAFRSGEMKEIRPVNLMEMRKKPSPAERRAKEKADEERRKLDTIMRNLEKYDGTDIGQEEVV